MKRSAEYLQSRLQTCQRLFFQYNGREHARIEREMRAGGFPDFNRRCLYPRGIKSGWIEKYGWDKQTESDNRDTLTPRKRPPLPPLNDFHAWIKKVSPPGYDWDAAHLRHVIEKLQLFTEGKIKKLMIFMPPRHGKSELVTTRYTAWRLMKDPTLKVILASYAQSLANRFSRNIRNTLAEHFSQNRLRERAASSSSVEEQDIQRRDAETQSQTLQKPAPSKGNTHDSDNEPLSNPFRPNIINSAAEWETGKGGGIKAVGVGGGITGYGAKLMMIDDPIKSREQAESASYRDKVWHWFNDDMMTRLEPDAGVILIQTRWHEDDLAGRLLKQQEEEGTDEWHVINLPAICEGPAGTNSGSPPYEGGVDAASADGVVLSPVKMMPAFTTAQPYVQGKTYGDIVRERAASQNRLRERAASSPGEQNTFRRNTETRSHGPAGVASDIFVAPGEAERNPGYSNPQDTGHRTSDKASSMALSGSDFPGSAFPAASAFNIPGDSLGRAPGEALWPERFDIKQLERIKRQMGTYSFEALYQQKPVPTEGGMFKRSWFTNNIVQVPPPNLNWKRGYDLSFTANPDSDPSATLRVAYDKDGVLYIDGCFRGKLTYPLQRKMLMHYIKTETRTEHGIELSANGHAILQDLRQMPELRGKKFRGVKVETNKLTRALPWIALAEEGRVRLVAGRWNEDFITEACAFPHGHHDDQIDAASIAVAMHSNGSRNGFWRF
jgi:predicted phage terminase large subunit-like protein